MGDVECSRPEIYISRFAGLNNGSHHAATKVGPPIRNRPRPSWNDQFWGTA